MLKHLNGRRESAEGSASDQRERTVLELNNVGVTEVKLAPLRRISAGRRGSNEVLNNLKTVARIILWPSSVHDGIATQAVLQDISVALPAGLSVAVLSTKPASGRALLDVASNVLSPDAGTVRRSGRVASLGQAWALVSPYYSCRENLELLGRLLGVSKADYRRAMEVVEGFDAKFRVLDLPLRRTPAWVFDDYALVLITELKFDLLIAPEANLPTSEAIAAYWAKYVESVKERDQLIVLGSRRPANLLTMASHLLLLDGERLVDFGPTEEVTERHFELVETALEAREERATALPLFEEDGDDDDDVEEDDDQAEITNLPHDETQRSSARIHAGEASHEDLKPQLSLEDQSSDMLDIIKTGPGEYSRLLLPDGTDAVPRPDDPLVPPGCKQLPIIFREDGGILRLVIETKEPDLWVQPAIYLRRRKTVALRSSAPEVYIATPSRIQFDVVLPVNLLQGWVFGISAVVGVVRRTLGIKDMAIAHGVTTFTNISREGREWQRLPKTEPLRQVPEAREMRIEEDQRYRIVALALEDASGIPLYHDVKGYHSADAAKRGLHAVFDVYVAAEPIKLVFVIDIKSRRTIILRLAPVERVLTPGTHRITVVVPPGLLTDNIYEICVGAMEPSEIGKVESVGREGELSALLRVDAGDERQFSEPWVMSAPLDVRLSWTRREPDGEAETP